MNINALAALVNQLGGYDEVENLIGVDAELLQRAIAGEPLNRRETAEIETGFNQIWLDESLLEDEGIDVQEFAELTDDLEVTERLIGGYDVTFQNQFREAVADGRVDLTDLNEGFTLFGNLTPSQADAVFEILDEPNAAQMLKEMFEAYSIDLESGDFFNVQDSAFWEWFREVFYPEAT